MRSAGSAKALPGTAMAVVLASLVACAGGSPPATGVAPDDTPRPVSDSAAQASMSAAQEIAELHTRWRAALASRDTAFFATTLVDNFQLTGGQATLSKSQFMMAVASDTGGVAPSRFDQTSIRLYGNVAVATGLIRYDIPGETGPAMTRYTEVWVREGRQWRAAHLHYNPVPPAAQEARP